MTVARIVLAGHIGPLAQAVARALEGRACPVSVLESPHLPESSGEERPSRILCFPFPAAMTRRVIEQSASDLSYLEAVLGWAERCGVRRVVLRSHAIAYGSSMKNPGLLDEGRPSLLPKTSVECRWLEAERLLFRMAGSGVEAETGRRPSQVVSPLPRSGFSAAAVRLTTVLDRDEGELITAMLTSRIASPLAGYDPQLQFLSLADAAEALVAALLSDAAGVFNAAGGGTVPVKGAIRAAVPLRVPLSGAIQKPIRSLLWRAGRSRFPGETLDRIKYNWTVSGERARRELSFVPQSSSSEALREFLRASRNGGAERIKDSYDEFGLDSDYLKKWEPWFNFLRKIYWRAEVEGLENIPAAGPAMLVANHRGFMPFDGVVHRATILEATKRHIRFLVIPSLFKFPFLSDFLIKQGGVVASQVNTQKLFERGELVGVFPEGISGAFRMYRGAYKLGDLGRNAFARMAVENSVPIIPCATIGHVEIFPILARVNSSLVTRITGWPFLPITTTFPLLPVPLPTKWHIRYLEPISPGLRPDDVNRPNKVNELAERVAAVMQRNIDDMLTRRKHIFFGNIFDRRASAARSRSAGASE